MPCIKWWACVGGEKMLAHGLCDPDKESMQLQLNQIWLKAKQDFFWGSE
jgi:hypothetical protein